MTGDHIHHYEQARDCLYAAYHEQKRAEAIRLAWKAEEHAKAFAEALEALRVEKNKQVENR